MPARESLLASRPVTRASKGPGFARTPLATSALALLAWAACDDADRPPRSEVAPAERAPAEASAPAPEPPPRVEHTVGPGETLWDIARAYGVEVSAIMEANEMRPRDVRRLREGRAIVIPGAAERVEVQTASDRAAAREEMLASLPELEDGAYHFLAAGETLWDVARLYDKTADELMTANDLEDEDVRGLRAGTPIAVPGVRPSQIRQQEPAQREGITHVVARGETVWDLAGAFQVSVSEIMAANGLSTEQVTALREGARLFVPGVTEDRAGRVRRRETDTQRRARPIARRIGLGTREAASHLLRGRVQASWIRAAGGRRDRLPGSLRWPVTNGRFVRGYGSGEGGYHLAVDIAGDIGWNVRAAAPGIVGYSGNEVRGYGNMVLVVHPGGWVTMYAHNSVNFVVAGQRVPRGAVLAELGSTGISRGPHVHFELIHAGQNCDPAHLFRPGIRHRGGRLTPIEPVHWTDPEGRPRAVRCAPRRRHPRSQWVINE